VTMLTVDRLLRKQLVICVGTGGVGKTTTAAALAVAAALQGRRSAVITVDPARRLKDALGLSDLSVEPHRIAIDPAAEPVLRHVRRRPPECGSPAEGGGLRRAGATHFEALALDTKRTFDALVERFAPSPAVAARILANRLYHELSNEIAGSAEYMAMEKLHELFHSRRYQIIVVDTPPSAHARDLLAAPNRLTNLLASRAVSVLQAPASLLSGATSSLGRLGLSTLLKALERWTGVELLHDLADFVGGFEEMVEGFHTRAEEVNRLLRAPSTAFVLVTSPEPRTIETTIGFQQELAAGGFPVGGIIANRMVAFPRLAHADQLLAEWDEPLRGKLRRNYAELRALAQRHRNALQRLHEQTRMPLLSAIPALTEAPTSLVGLRRFAELLAPSQGSTKLKAES